MHAQRVLGSWNGRRTEAAQCGPIDRFHGSYLNRSNSLTVANYSNSHRGREHPNAIREKRHHTNSIIFLAGSRISTEMSGKSNSSPSPPHSQECPATTGCIHCDRNAYEIDCKRTFRRVIPALPALKLGGEKMIGEARSSRDTVRVRRHVL